MAHDVDLDARERERTPQRAQRHVLCCLLPQTLSVLFVAGVLLRGWWLGLTPVVVLVVLPGLDLLTRWRDDRRFEEQDFSAAARALLRWNVRLYAIVDVACVLFATTLVRRLSGLELGLLLASASLTSAVGFAAAHELIHAGARSDRVLARILTTFLFYPHYKLIHIYSHHVHASTPRDENTAWHGESIYGYLLRTVPGSLVRCWQLDAERRLRESGSDRRRWLGNRMLAYAAGQLLLLAAIDWLSGLPGLLFYVAHVFGAHIVLESVNYIQHYGLLRQPTPGGPGYERTGPDHAWDSYQFFSSFVTFRVGHHSNHHLSAGPYYLLAPQRRAPELPVGYFWAIGMVLVPAIWRRVMHPRLHARAEQL